MARMLKESELPSPFSWMWVGLAWFLVASLLGLLMARGSGEGSSSGVDKGKKRKHGEGDSKKKVVSEREKKKAEKEKKAAEMKKKDWVTSMPGKSVICERQVDRVDIGSHPIIDTITRRGLNSFFDPVRGYIHPLVVEFYTKMNVKEGKRVITSKVKGKNIEITPNRIAEYLDYERPHKDTITFPIAGKEVHFPTPILVHDMFTNVEEFVGKFEMGLMNQNYRVLNKVVKYNIYPRGNEKKPTERGAELLYAIMNNNVVLDVALFIYKQIVDFYCFSEKRSAIIFPHMITQMCLEQAGLKADAYQWTPGKAGPVNKASLSKSDYMSKAPPKPSIPANFTPKSKKFQEKVEEWFRAILCRQIDFEKEQRKSQRRVEKKVDFCVKILEQQAGTSYQATVSSDEEPDYEGDYGEGDPEVEWRGDGMDGTSDEEE